MQGGNPLLAKKFETKTRCGFGSGGEMICHSGAGPRRRRSIAERFSQQSSSDLRAIRGDRGWCELVLDDQCGVRRWFRAYGV